jgi:hypothetical protein
LRLGSDKFGPVLIFIPVATFADEGFVGQPSVTMTCAIAVSTATLVPGAKRQMMRRLDMRRSDKVGAARVDDDQLGTLIATAASCGWQTPDARRSGWRR